MRRHRHAGILLLAAAMLAAGGCTERDQGARLPPACGDVQVLPGDIARKVPARGRVEPRRTITVRAAAEGRVTELLVSKGDSVRKGQALAKLTLDSKFQLNFTQAMLTLKSARLKRRSLENQIARSEQLREAGLMSQLQVQDLQSTLEEILLQEQVALERIREVEVVTGFRIDTDNIGQPFPDVTETLLRSPDDGTVLNVLADPGEEVDPARRTGSPLTGGAVLLLGDLDGYRLIARVSELDVNRIEDDQTVLLDFDAIPGRSMTAKVKWISPFGSTDQPGEPDGGRYGISHFDVEVALWNPDPGIRPGLSFRASFIVEEARQILTLPIQAVVAGKGGHFVFRKEGDMYREHPVATGLSDEFRVQIIKGLDQGDLVCDHPLAFMEALERARRREGSGPLERIFGTGSGPR